MGKLELGLLAKLAEKGAITEERAAKAAAEAKGLIRPGQDDIISDLLSRYGEDGQKWLDSAKSGKFPYERLQDAPIPIMNKDFKISEPFQEIGHPGIQENYQSKYQEAFPWMDTRYNHSKNILLDAKSKNLPVTVNTSSDLIARDDYLEALHPESKINIYMPTSNDRINRLLFPGNPSRLRLEKAAEKLKSSGFDVNIVEPTREDIEKAISNKVGNPLKFGSENEDWIKEALDQPGLFKPKLTPIGGFQSPLVPLGMLANKYEKAKEAVFSPAAKQMNFSGKPEDAEMLTKMLSIGADPINAVSGPIGHGLQGLQLMGDMAQPKEGTMPNIKRGPQSEAFDPKAYAEAPFDPQAYAASPIDDFDPKAYASGKLDGVAQDNKSIDYKKAGRSLLTTAAPGLAPFLNTSEENKAKLEGIGQGMSFNYLNNLKAASEPLTFGLLNKITGQDVKPDDYLQARDYYNKKTEETKAQNPEMYYSGAVPGMAISGEAAGSVLGPASLGKYVKDVPKIGKALNVVTNIAEAAGKGAIIGAVQNPGEKAGVIDPLQLDQRAEQAKFGGMIGAGVQTGIEGIKGISSLKDSIKDFAAHRMEKQIGADTATQSKKLIKSGKDGAIGRQLLDEGDIGPFDKPKQINDKLEARANELVNQLQGHIDEADKILQRPEGFNMENATPEEIALAKKGYVQTSDIKDLLIKDLRKQYEGVPEEEIAPAIDKIETWFKDRPEDMNTQEWQKMKTSLNKFLRDSDFYRSVEPGLKKQGLLAVRKGAKEAIEQKSNAAADIIGGEKGPTIKETNRKLGNILQAQDVNQDKLYRDAGNRSLSASDYWAGAIKGLPGVAFNKLLRTYGNGVMAWSANRLANELAASDAYFANMAKQSPGGLIAISQGLLNQNKSEARKP